MKVLIIGLGKLGGGIAHKLLQLGVSELYLYGNSYDKTIGLAFDLNEIDIKCKVVVLRSIKDLPEVDYTFFTFSKLKWNDSISVNDRIIDGKNNLKIISTLANEISFEYFGTIIIVSNPVDILTRFCYENCGSSKVFGFGNSLDEVRVNNSISKNAIERVSNELICLGEHGKGIVPILSRTIAADKLNPALYEKLNKETFIRTQEIIKNTSIPFHAPLFALETFLTQLLNKKSFTITLSTYLNDTWCGVKGLAIGVPVEFENGNDSRFSKIEISEFEQELFFNSANELKKVYQSVL